MDPSPTSAHTMPADFHCRFVLSTDQSIAFDKLSVSVFCEAAN